MSKSSKYIFKRFSLSDSHQILIFLMYSKWVEITITYLINLILNVLLISSLLNSLSTLSKSFYID